MPDSTPNRPVSPHPPYGLGAGAVIDCSANPYDLRPAIDATVAAIEKIRADMPAGQPLFVGTGEIHNRPSNVIFPLILADRLLHAETPARIACGIELTHDFLKTGFEKTQNPDPSPALLKKMAEIDGDGQRILPAFLSYTIPAEAPVSLFTLLDFYRRRNLSTRFNDTVTKVEPYSAKDIKLRNVVMMEKSVAHARDTKAEIYILSGGQYHLLGLFQKYPYKDSLVVKFREAGAAILPVLLADFKQGSKNDMALPAEALNDASRNAVVITNHTDIEFNGFSHEEAPFILRLAHQSGIEIEPFVHLNFNGRVSQARHAMWDLVEHQRPAWIAETEAQP